MGTSNIYESQDSSYTQLDVSNQNAPLCAHDGRHSVHFRTSDEQQRISLHSDQRPQRQLHLRHLQHDNGHLLTITDTLGRVITFVYGPSNNLQAIRQTWSSPNDRDWATFNYGQVYVAPAFGGGLLVNGPNNNYTTVLTQVKLHDGSVILFDYNAAFAQVTRINHYAADTHAAQLHRITT